MYTYISMSVIPVLYHYLSLSGLHINGLLHPSIHQRSIMNLREAPVVNQKTVGIRSKGYHILVIHVDVCFICFVIKLIKERTAQISALVICPLFHYGIAVCREIYNTAHKSHCNVHHCSKQIPIKAHCGRGKSQV